MSKLNFGIIFANKPITSIVMPYNKFINKSLKCTPKLVMDTFLVFYYEKIDILYHIDSNKYEKPLFLLEKKSWAYTD